MIERVRILRSLDPHHARIGYLGALALVATRSLDTFEALAARFHTLLFERIFHDDQRFQQLLNRVPPDRRDDLKQRMLRPEDEDPSAAFLEPAAKETPAPKDWLLSASRGRPQPRLVATNWLYISEFWLYDECMPSPLGFLSREKADRTIDMARWTDILLPTLELSENGYLLQHLLVRARNDAGALFNPLNPICHPCLPLLYFRIMLGAEALYPFILCELVRLADNGERPATRGDKGLLRAAVKSLLDNVGPISDPEDALALADVEQFRESIERKQSTEENYLRPRLEILVDLGLLERRGTPGGGKRSEFVWEVSDRTRTVANELSALATVDKILSGELENFLDRRFFSSMGRVFGTNYHPVATEIDRLSWFAKAFADIGREFGFTPGRTLALKACFMAWEAGQIMEVGDVFDTVYRAARSRFEKYLHFSGGSRFDREFLIRIDDELLARLQDTNTSDANLD